MLRVTSGLGDLGSEVVFFGGSITPLLVTDPGASAIRPTDGSVPGFKNEWFAQALEHADLVQVTDGRKLRGNGAASTLPSRDWSRWRLSPPRSVRTRSTALDCGAPLTSPASAKHVGIALRTARSAVVTSAEGTTAA